MIDLYVFLCSFGLKNKNPVSSFAQAAARIKELTGSGRKPTQVKVLCAGMAS
jgi:hypothetical protein